MGKKNYIIVIGILFLLIINIIGCTEKSIETKEEKKVFLESDLIELVESSLDLTEKHGEITQAEVSFRFKSTTDQTVNIIYLVEFCDKDGEVLHQAQKRIDNLPPGYTEYSPNIFTFIGDSTKNVHHVNIRVIDHEFVE